MKLAISILPLRTSIFRARESLLDFILQNVDREQVAEGMVLAVTSKIVSLAEGRLVPGTAHKPTLIENEADYNFGEVGYGCYLTVNHGLFIPSAGIDESNSEHGDFILYPVDPFQSARSLGEALRGKWKLKMLGIVITDSHTTPLRRGVTGISLAHWGFRGVSSLIGRPDLFGRAMQMTTINVADGLAAAATLFMGEGSECQPLALVHGAGVEFTDFTDPAEVKMPLEQDLYFPFFREMAEKADG